MELVRLLKRYLKPSKARKKSLKDLGHQQSPSTPRRREGLPTEKRRMLHDEADEADQDRASQISVGAESDS